MNRKIAILTGHSGTLGRRIAEKLTNLSYYVIGISKSSCPNVVNEEFIMDFSEINYELYYKIKELIIKRGRLKTLVCAAGLGYVKRFEELEWIEYQKILNVNLNSPILITNLCYKIMKQYNEEGIIILISSQVALPGCSQPYNSIYSVTKCGLNGLVKSLAYEAGPKIRINSVCPGDFKSRLAIEGGQQFCNIEGLSKNEYEERVINRSAIKRWLEPDEVANAVAFLIKNPSYTGVLFNVTGGSCIS